MVLSKMFPPGFRFNPTNQELIMYYLKRKVLGKRIWDGVISELDIYKYVPWELPNLACLQSRDLNWYFLCARPEKRGTSGSNRRVIGSGYWKITGRGRPVRHKERDVGEIKSLTYYKYADGGSRNDVKTEWTMHEYRLVDPELNGVVQDSHVLSKIFEKSGPGPMNGAEYGAPFEEEEWEDDDDCEKNETERIVASLAEGPSAGIKNQQGPPPVTARILLEGTEGPSRHEGLAVTGNHNRGLVFSPADQQVSHGTGVLSFMDLVMTDPNAHEKAIPASDRPQGQFPAVTVCGATGTEERSDNCPDADMLANGTGQDQVMQGADDLNNGLFDNLEELEELHYLNPLNNHGYIPECPLAESTYADGDFLEERDIDGANIWSNAYGFMNDSGI